MQPYTLGFEDVHHGSTFHQCVFIRVKPEPEVAETAAKTHAAYGGDPHAPYMPHASLLYSDLEETRR